MPNLKAYMVDGNDVINASRFVIHDGTLIFIVNGSENVVAIYPDGFWTRVIGDNEVAEEEWEVLLHHDGVRVFGTARFMAERGALIVGENAFASGHWRSARQV